MIASDPLVTNPLMASVTFDPVRDFAPIITIATLSQVLAVHPSVPANNFAEFIALAKVKPDTINVGTSGRGAPGHLAIALLAQAGVPLVHVPYRGAGPGGRRRARRTDPGHHRDASRHHRHDQAEPAARARRHLLAPLALHARAAGDDRAAAGHGRRLLAGVSSRPPARRPTSSSGSTRNSLTLLKTKEVLDSFETQGFEAGGGSPEDLGKFVRDETAKWAPIMKAAGIKAE